MDDLVDAMSQACLQVASTFTTDPVSQTIIAIILVLGIFSLLMNVLTGIGYVFSAFVYAFVCLRDGGNLLSWLKRDLKSKDSDEGTGR